MGWNIVYQLIKWRRKGKKQRTNRLPPPPRMVFLTIVWWIGCLLFIITILVVIVMIIRNISHSMFIQFACYLSENEIFYQRWKCYNLWCDNISPYTDHMTKNDTAINSVINQNREKWMCIFPSGRWIYQSFYCTVTHFS